MTAKRMLPLCTERIQRGEQAGWRCNRPARFAFVAMGRQGFVCGNHRRGWRASALFYVSPIEPPWP